MDGFELMNLGPGSIINHRNVFIDSELFRFTAVATVDSTVYEISKDDMIFFQKKHDKMGRQIDIEIANILKKKKRYIIDVIPGFNTSKKSNNNTLSRSIGFKNVAFQMMFEHKFSNIARQQMAEKFQKKIKSLKAMGIPTSKVDADGDEIREELDMKKPAHKEYLKKMII